MVSAVESMAANTSWSALGKATDLRNRILFTLGLLIVYRLGTFIPVPGIDGTALRQFMESAGQGIGGMVSMFTGGALGRMGIFALGIMPYISASIIVQLMTSMVPALEQLKKEGEQGRKKINQYTRFGTVALATLQAYGLAVSLEAGDIAADPGMYFRIACMITLVGGTMFLMWLGEQITARGVGNGISLIIFVGIVAEIPAALARFFEQGRTGAISTPVILGVIVMVVAVVAFVVALGATVAAAPSRIDEPAQVSEHAVRLLDDRPGNPNGVPLPASARPVDVSRPDHVIGTGTPASSMPCWPATTNARWCIWRHVPGS